MLDVDEGPEKSPAVALALLQVARANGLTAALAWSGRKGCHVWIFSDPVARDTMRAVLKRLKDAVPHTGEIIPLEVQRVKLAPALHQEAGTWSYWYPADTTPTLRADPPDLAEQAPSWPRWCRHLPGSWKPMRRASVTSTSAPAPIRPPPYRI